MIQTAFYYLNMDLGDVESYHAILEELGLDKEEFSNGFHSNKFKELVKEDFQRARELGVRSFPTLLFQSGPNTIVLAQGYLSAESVSEAILRARKH